MPDKILEVKWLVVDKRLIKIVDGDSYNIAEDVDIEGIDVGSLITIELKDSVIVKLKKEDVKGKEKKEEVKKLEKDLADNIDKDEKPEPTEPEDCPEEETEAQVEERVKKFVKGEDAPYQEQPVEEAKIQPLTWTISAIAFEKGVVKFAEQETEKYWYPIAPEAKDAFKGLKKGDSIQIVIGKVDAESQSGDKYQKDGVVQAKAVAIKEEPKSEEGTRKAYTNTTNDSIERQVALKEAGAIIRSLIDHGGENVNSEDKINKLLSSFTKGSLEALRNA